MKPKRVLAVLIAACMMVMILPSFASAASVGYDPGRYPELYLFNKYTSENSDFYKNKQSDKAYNAIAAQKSNPSAFVILTSANEPTGAAPFRRTTPSTSGAWLSSLATPGATTRARKVLPT